MPGTTWSAAVVADGGEGTGPTVLLTATRRAALGGSDVPARRIAFNACECLQRVCKEHRWVNLRALDLCLLTALRPSHALGLPGVVLALSEIGAAKLTVRGPGGTENFVASVSEFVRRKRPRSLQDLCLSVVGSTAREISTTLWCVQRRGEACVDARVVSQSLCAPSRVKNVDLSSHGSNIPEHAPGITPVPAPLLDRVASDKARQS